ncbi:hypothetical protein KAR34_08220 [bacterium]|nr:hypothetical protein [bacterium]
MEIYADNPAYQVAEADLCQAFEAFGKIESVSLIRNKYNGASKKRFIERIQLLAAVKRKPGIKHYFQKINVGLLLIVILIVWLNPIMAFSAGSKCRLEREMYEKRKLLKTEYYRNREKNQELAGKLQKQIKAIDRKYYWFMRSLCEAYDINNTKFINECCKETGFDPIAVQICNQAAYLTGRKNPEVFIAAFPANSDEFAVFWMQDEIAFSRQSDLGMRTLPELYLPNGPVYKNIDELFLLVKENNKKAVEKYFGLLVFADGCYAEYVCDQVKDLFLNYPKIVLANWEEIKANKALVRSSAYFSAEDIRKIEHNFKSISQEENRKFEEILSVFNITRKVLHSLENQNSRRKHKQDNSR